MPRPRKPIINLQSPNLPHDGVEAADELLVPMALHVLADHSAFAPIECGECRLESRLILPEARRRHDVPQQPFFSSNPGCVRSSAWIWLFSARLAICATAFGAPRPAICTSAAARQGAAPAHRADCLPTPSQETLAGTIRGVAPRHSRQPSAQSIALAIDCWFPRSRLKAGINVGVADRLDARLHLLGVHGDLQEHAPDGLDRRPMPLRAFGRLTP
jgi:hypothetical protein